MKILKNNCGGPFNGSKLMNHSSDKSVLLSGGWKKQNDNPNKWEMNIDLPKHFRPVQGEVKNKNNKLTILGLGLMLDGQSPIL